MGALPPLRCRSRKLVGGLPLHETKPLQRPRPSVLSSSAALSVRATRSSEPDGLSGPASAGRSVVAALDRRCPVH